MDGFKNIEIKNFRGIDLRENETMAYYDKHFGCLKGQKLTMPAEYLPNRDFLAYHRENVFVGA